MLMSKATATDSLRDKLIRSGLLSTQIGSTWRFPAMSIKASALAAAVSVASSTAAANSLDVWTEEVYLKVIQNKCRLLGRMGL